MISRGRARWAKTERAQWSRDHQTNNTVPTQNGASCCAPFFFFCRSRFCFFFFFPRPTRSSCSVVVVGVHLGAHASLLAAFVHAVSSAMDLRWIPPEIFREILRPGPPPPLPETEEDRGSSRRGSSDTDGGGSLPSISTVPDPWKRSEARWQVIYSRTSSRHPPKVDLWTREFRFIRRPSLSLPPSLPLSSFSRVPRFYFVLSFLVFPIQRNSLDSLDRSRYLILSRDDSSRLRIDRGRR